MTISSKTFLNYGGWETIQNLDSVCSARLYTLSYWRIIFWQLLANQDSEIIYLSNFKEPQNKTYGDLKNVDMSPNPLFRNVVKWSDTL